MVKTRFAPSPTGHLHIGGLRSALFNYIFAKHYDGLFVLRIEDTDLKRSDDEYTDGIFEAFSWCGIESDEPVIFQSKRSEIYRAAINRMLLSGLVYKDTVIDEEGKPGEVLKCKVPKNEIVSFFDLVRGEISFNTNEIEDFIICRSDGSPLYNLVVVVDDIEMGITHVIRGEEHITNTPRQLLLYRALNKVPPFFAHLPLILGHDRKKLSKRDATTSVIDYRAMGILPGALCNYLLRLGWSYGDEEIISVKRAIEIFDIGKVQHAGAIFDFQKLLWVNHQLIKSMSSADLYTYMAKENFLNEWSIQHKDMLIRVIEILRERCKTVVDLAKYCNYFDPMITIDMHASEIGIAHEIIDRIIRNFFHEAHHMFMTDEESVTRENDWKILIKKVSEKTSVEQHLCYSAIRFLLLGEVSAPSLCKLLAVGGYNTLLGRGKRFLPYSSIL